MRSSECRMQNAECRMENAELRNSFFAPFAHSPILLFAVSFFLRFFISPFSLFTRAVLSPFLLHS